MNEGKSETASSYSGWQFLKDMVEAGKAEQEHPLLAVSGMIEAQECKHRYRVSNGLNMAIRWCVEPGCTKSWRMPTQGYHPYPEWEPIKEGVERELRVLPDYDDLDDDPGFDEGETDD